VKVAELIDMVRLLSQRQDLTDGAVLQALNVAQEDVSRNLRAPIQTVFYPAVNSIGAFNWPSDARDEGVLAVYALQLDSNGDVTSSKQIPVWDFNTASVYEPSWTYEKPASEARFIVHDPTYEIATPYPVPPPDSQNVQSFRITYVVRPTKMVELTDEPFNGRLESFHDILAYRATWLLTQSQAMLFEFERRMREARGASNHGVITAVNPLYRRNVIQSGRG